MNTFPIDMVMHLLDLRDQFFEQTIDHYKSVLKHGVFIEVDRCQRPDDTWKKVTILNPSMERISRASSLLKFELRRLGVPPNKRQLLAMRLQSLSQPLLQPSSVSDDTGNSDNENHQDESP